MRHNLSLEVERERRVERLLAMLQDYKAGMKISEIAAKYDMAMGTISTYARRAGMGRNNRLDSVRPLIADAYRNGLRLKLICSTFNVDRKTVWRIAESAGLPLRKGRKPT